MAITREIHKKTGQVIFGARRTGGRKQYDTVTYVAKDENNNRVEIPASEYRSYITAYRVGDVIEDRPDFKKEITKLTKKSANWMIAEITVTHKKRMGVWEPGSTQVWEEEMEGRIV